MRGTTYILSLLQDCFFYHFFRFARKDPKKS